jgi:LAO/AO transport system kinase
VVFYNRNTKLLESTKKAVQNGEISPFAAAQLLLKSILKNKPS